MTDLEVAAWVLVDKVVKATGDYLRYYLDWTDREKKIDAAIKEFMETVQELHEEGK